MSTAVPEDKGEKDYIGGHSIPALSVLAGGVWPLDQEAASTSVPGPEADS